MRRIISDKVKIMTILFTLTVVTGSALSYKVRMLNTFFSAPFGATICTVPTQVALTKTIAGGSTVQNLTDVFGAQTPCTIRVTPSP